MRIRVFDQGEFLDYTYVEIVCVLILWASAFDIIQLLGQVILDFIELIIVNEFLHENDGQTLLGSTFLCPFAQLFYIFISEIQLERVYHLQEVYGINKIPFRESCITKAQLVFSLFGP